MLTRPGGPVVVSERSLLALAAIRRQHLLGEMFGEVALPRSSWPVAAGALGDEPPAWLVVLDDRPDVVLPTRCDETAGATAAEAAALRLAVGLPASLVIIDGPVKEKAKLSFIKCEGVVGLLVQAYRTGRLTAVPPMVKALQKLGYTDVVPAPHLLEAMYQALEAMG